MSLSGRLWLQGPHFTVVGYTYEDYDYDISTEIQAHPGLGLYSLSKGCGQEICKVFAENHPIHVILCLFLSFPATDEPSAIGQGTNAFSVTFSGALNHQDYCHPFFFFVAALFPAILLLYRRFNAKCIILNAEIMTYRHSSLQTRRDASGRCSR